MNTMINTCVFGDWRQRIVFDKPGEGSGGGDGDGTDTNTPPAGEAAEGTKSGEDETGSGGEKPAKPDGNSTVVGGAKPGEEPESGDGKGEDEGEEPEGVPEEYTFDELPEGTEVDEKLAEKVSPLFKELGLNNTQANQLATAYAEHIQADAEARASEWQQTNEKWVAEAKADPEISEMGWDTAVEAANKFIDTFGGKELSEAIATGVNGNHPAVIRAFAKAGAALGSDQTETGTSGGNADAPPEERWYGSK